MPDSVRARTNGLFVVIATTLIRVEFPDLEQPLIHIEHPPASVRKPKYLTDNQLVELKEAVISHLHLLMPGEKRDVAEFGHCIYLLLAGYVLHEGGMACPYYLKWRLRAKEQRTYVTSSK